MTRTPYLSLFLLAAVWAVNAGAADDEATKEEQLQRAGTCEEAQTQMKYWCEERQQVTVVTTGLECENAKRNVKEACEGVKSEDHDYQ